MAHKGRGTYGGKGSLTYESSLTLLGVFEGRENIGFDRDRHNKKSASLGDRYQHLGLAVTKNRFWTYCRNQPHCSETALSSRTIQLLPESSDRWWW